MKKIITLCVIHLTLYTLAFANSPYISRVYEYSPAPGQFINALPTATDTDDAESMAQKAEEALANNANSMVCLGSFGGYIIFGFDHAVQNVAGSYDFQVYGNASTNSAEPGIVSVSVDENENGIPDDAWYELAGSNYDSIGTIHNYAVTYYRPDSLADIVWKDNQGSTGTIDRNSFHKQDYYPLWYADSVTFTGTCLPSRAHDTSGKGTYYVLPAFAWGYVDNQPGTDSLSSFDISWAVDSEGHSVNLTHIDFVRVHTAQNQKAGWLGETSTEVRGAIDLHPDHEVVISLPLTNANNNQPLVVKTIVNGKIVIVRDGVMYNTLGQKIR